MRALLRRVQVEGASAFVVRSGAEDAGAIILVVARLDGTVLVLNQVRECQGRTGLGPAPGRLDRRGPRRGWCDRQVKFDPDLWIVEIEDRQGRAFVDEPIV